MLYLPSSSDVLGTKSATSKFCLILTRTGHFVISIKHRHCKHRHYKHRHCVIVHTGIIRLHEAKWSVIDGDRQEAEVVRVAHTCCDETQSISVDGGTKCMIKCAARTSSHRVQTQPTSTGRLDVLFHLQLWNKTPRKYKTQYKA